MMLCSEDVNFLYLSFVAGCWNAKASRISSLYWFWNESRWSSSHSVDLWEGFGRELPCARSLGTLQSVFGKEKEQMLAVLFSYMLGFFYS